MKPKAKKILIISIISVLVISIVVVVILIIRANRQGKGNKTGKENNDNNNNDNNNNNNNQVNDSNQPLPFTLSTDDECNNFRAWVNDNYNDYAREIDLDRNRPSNSCNSYAQRAWEKYGSEYTKKVLKK